MSRWDVLLKHSSQIFCLIYLYRSFSACTGFISSLLKEDYRPDFQICFELFLWILSSKQSSTHHSCTAHIHNLTMRLSHINKKQTRSLLLYNK